MSSKDIPQKPFIPLLFFVAISLISGLRLSLFEVFTIEGTHYVLSVSVLLLLALFYARKNTKVIKVLVLIIVFLSANLNGGYRLSKVKEQASSFTSSEIRNYQFKIESFPRKTKYNTNYKASFVGCDNYRYMVNITCEDELDIGQEVLLEGLFCPIEDSNFQKQSYAQANIGTIKPTSIKPISQKSFIQNIAVRLNHFIVSQIKPKSSPERALMCASVCADKYEFSQKGLNEIFSRCGISHMVCVSGMHLVVLMGLFNNVFLRHNIKPRVRFSILSAIGFVYILCCGASKSAIRAFIMGIVGFLGQVGKRRKNCFASLGLCVLIMILIDPFSASNLGFILSFAAVSGLCLFSYPLYWLLYKKLRVEKLELIYNFKVRIFLNKLVDYTLQTISASLVAQVITLPFTLSIFGQLPLLAPVVNLFVAPIFYIFLPLCFIDILFSKIWPLNIVLFTITDFLSHLIILIARYFSHFKFCSVEINFSLDLLLIVLGIGVVLVMALSKKKTRKLLVVVFLAGFVATVYSIYWSFFVPARIVMLDVGQGDAILFQQNSTSVLIDTGPPGQINDALARNHVRSIDAVIITHLHDDHYAGLIDMVDNYKVGSVYVAQGAKENMPDDLRDAAMRLCSDKVLELSYKDKLEFEDCTLEVLWPRKEVSGKTNPDSIIARVIFDDKKSYLSILTTGDAEEDEIRNVISHGDIGKIDVLKVGHHGSAVSIDEASAAFLHPTLSICSCGRNNEYGHPKKQCTDILKNVGSEFIATKDVGDIYLFPQSEGIGVDIQNKEYLDSIKAAA